MDLHDEARAAQDAARGEIQSSGSLEDLDAVRVKYLGRKGEITLLLRKLGKVEPDKRKEVGGLLNEVKVELASLIESRKQDLKQEKYAPALEQFRRAVTGTAPVNEAYVCIIECWAMQGDFIKAREALTEAKAKRAIPAKRLHEIETWLEQKLAGRP